MAGGIATKPNIKGGDYHAIDTGDGWYILRNIPTLAAVKKGEKGAPEDAGTEWLNDAKKFGQESYEKGKIAYPIHLTHTDDLGLHNPVFAGYFKPSKVEDMNLPERGNTPVLFSDFKIKKDVFETMSKGELGYVSPEVRNWKNRRISSVALLDSIPPHNPFPLMTIGSVTVDPTAVFSADLPKECSIAKFEDGKERIKFDYDDTKPGHKEPDDDDKPAKCCGHCEANRTTIQKMSQDLYGGKMEAGKPDGNTVEQKEAKPTQQGAQANIRMEEDPKLMAKFAALEDKNAALAKRLDERDQKEKAEQLAAKALGELREYQIGETTKTQVAKFAMQGEAALKDFVAAVKEVAMKESPKSLYEAELASAVKLNDPVIAKFGGNDPSKQEKVARFASDFRTFKKTVGKGSRITEEEWIAQAVKEAELGGNV